VVGRRCASCGVCGETVLPTPTPTPTPTPPGPNTCDGTRSFDLFRGGYTSDLGDVDVGIFRGDVVVGMFSDSGVDIAIAIAIAVAAVGSVSVGCGENGRPGRGGGWGADDGVMAVCE